MTTETATNPVGDDASRVQPEGVADPGTTAQTDDIDTEAFDRMPAPDDEDLAEPEDGATGEAESADKPEPADAETVEIEIGGRKVSVPKAVEPFLMMQGDYTKKTQEVAARRREVEEQAAALAQKEAQQAESLKTYRAEHAAIAQGEAALAQLDAQLADYRKLTPQDWATLRAQQPEQYSYHSDNYEFLRRTRTSTEDALTAARKDLTDKEARLTAEQQRASSAKLKEEWDKTHQALSSQIEGWSPQRFHEVAKFAAETYSYTGKELEAAPDPRPWKMASDLMAANAEIAKLKQALKQQTTAQNNAKAQTVQPAAERPRGTSQPRGVNDTLSTEEWVRRRNAQLARKGR